MTWHLDEPDAHKLSTALEDQTDELADVIGLWEAENGLWSVEAYLKAGQNTDQALEIVRPLAETLGVTLQGYSHEVLSDRNWVAEGLKDLKPLSAGRFFIHGQHDRNERRGGGINIELDAGQAFGTGHHGTTLGCLIALDKVLKYQSPQNMLDLGCGTGILAIAAARATSRPVLASDIDPIAVQVTRANAKINNVGPLINAVTAVGTHHAVLQTRAPYDLIMANILAGPLMKLAPKITPLLTPKGRLILSGLLLHQAARIIARYRTQGLVLVSREELDGWATLTLVHP